jgi:hypothetical protein
MNHYSTEYTTFIRTIRHEFWHVPCIDTCMVPETYCTVPQDTAYSIHRGPAAHRASANQWQWPYLLRRDDLLDCIIPCKRRVHHKVHHADPRPQPEVGVEVTVVQISREPALPAAGLGRDSDERDDERVHLVRERHRQELERRAQAALGRGRLGGEELELGYAAEHVGAGQDHELRELPSDAQVVAGSDAAQPPHLDQRGCAQSWDRQEPADAHPLQERQSRRISDVFSG